jgi:dynein heavy chain
MKRKVYTTSKTFLDFVELYKLCLTKRREEIGGRKNRLASGVDKIISTYKNVAELKIQLLEL